MRDISRVPLIRDTNKPPDLIESCQLSNPMHHPQMIHTLYLACKKRGHQIHICSVFNGWIFADRINVFRELGLCMNCLIKRAHVREMSSTTYVQKNAQSIAIHCCIGMPTVYHQRSLRNMIRRKLT